MRTNINDNSTNPVSGQRQRSNLNLEQIGHVFKMVFLFYIWPWGEVNGAFGSYGFYNISERAGAHVWAKRLSLSRYGDFLTKERCNLVGFLEMGFLFMVRKMCFRRLSMLNLDENGGHTSNNGRFPYSYLSLHALIQITVNSWKVLYTLNWSYHGTRKERMFNKFSTIPLLGSVLIY